MTEDPVRDLTQLRNQFLTLRDALAANDVAAVDAATAALRAALTSFSAGQTLPPEAQDLLRGVAQLSGEVADTLSSRLHAFDLVIEALRQQEGASS
jgi:hypothetical protein